jgi:hypothetical protein
MSALVWTQTAMPARRGKNASRASAILVKPPAERLAAPGAAAGCASHASDGDSTKTNAKNGGDRIDVLAKRLEREHGYEARAEQNSAEPKQTQEGTHLLGKSRLLFRAHRET